MSWPTLHHLAAHFCKAALESILAEHVHFSPPVLAWSLLIRHCCRQAGGANAQPHPSDYDPTNTTLFIGGLSSSVTEEDLRVLFGRYGDIVYTKIPPGKGCGFVQFVQRPAAEAAMGQMQVRHVMLLLVTPAVV